MHQTVYHIRVAENASYQVYYLKKNKKDLTATTKTFQ